MATTSAPISNEFTWEVQPAAARWVARAVDRFAEQNSAIGRLASLSKDETGTRLVDWVDHLVLAGDDRHRDVSQLADELTEVGFVGKQAKGAGPSVWRHPAGMFPPVVVDPGRTGMAIRVDSVDDASTALPPALGLPHRLAATRSGARPDESMDVIVGQPGGPYRQACLCEENGIALWLTERHGHPGFSPPAADQDKIDAAAGRLEAFRNRQRTFTDSRDGFEYTSQVFAAAAEELGTAWACDLFFFAERAYWQSRNRAGQVQYERQNKLGLGWANHDHHTYRSSRRAFRSLIAALEQMGFVCRERFYAGREAGWGAQVLEQSDCRIVIFADVDLSPDEVLCDFAHEPLEERDALGTVGLWCELHGEAFLAAGMHHLECQFDFDAARDQLAAAGIETLAPFTDFPFLRQAFTRGETWPVDPARIARLLTAGRITPEQADRFRRDGAIGSHLEILERNDGYKGFNQTGISDIITRTDPRRVIGA